MIKSKGIQSGEYIVRLGQSSHVDTSNAGPAGEYRVHRSVVRLGKANDKALYSINSTLRAKVVGSTTGTSRTK